MNDTSAYDALRSDGPLVVIEAPAGCGKTWHGGELARDLVASEQHGRVLVLTHTHAACLAFSERASDAPSRLEIRTIDSLITEIASKYHAGLGLPPDVATWARRRNGGHQQVAMRVARLLDRYPMIPAALARRYPAVICDEHQDSSGDQHRVVMSLHEHGSRLRIFGDPMQRVFSQKQVAGGHPAHDWQELAHAADTSDILDTPHRWSDGCPELGRWTLAARAALKKGGRVDLRSNLPPSVVVVYAENEGKRRFDYRLKSRCRRNIDYFQNRETSLLVLTRYNETARAFRGFFGRRVPLWEGHTRQFLETLVDAVLDAEGDAAAVASAVVAFMEKVATGFTRSSFGNLLVEEVREGCTRKRKGKPAVVQTLARLVMDEPDHRGVSKVLQRVAELRKSDSAFASIKLDCQREFWDAARVGNYATVEAALAELTHRRTYARPKPPRRAISTIHKAKGLQCDAVAVIPCDANTFPDKDESRCLLYVAISRPKKRLLLVVSRDNPSPLLEI